MFPRFLSIFTGLFLPAPKKLENEESFDVVVSQDPTVFELERLQISRDGAIVGATAMIGDGSVTVSRGRLPSGHVCWISCSNCYQFRSFIRRRYEAYC
jgi:hypothetical protein